MKCLRTLTVLLVTALAASPAVAYQRNVYCFDYTEAVPVTKQVPYTVTVYRFRNGQLVPVQVTRVKTVREWVTVTKRVCVPVP